MKIAVASQNQKHVTGHSGRCRRFWIYDTDEQTIRTKQLVELTVEQTFHASAPDLPEALSGVQVLITGGMGRGLVRRLGRHQIQGVVTPESDPDAAVQAYLAGTLETQEPEDHDHDHDHADDVDRAVQAAD